VADKKYSDEYLVAITPFVDEKLWDEALGSIDKKLDELKKKYSGVFDLDISKLQKLNSNVKSVNEQEEKVVKKNKIQQIGNKNNKQNNQLSQSLFGNDLKKYGNEIIGQLGKSIGVNESLIPQIGGATSAIGVAVEIIKQVVEIGEQLADQASTISNDFVSSDSIFTNSGIKNIMSNLGVSTTTAQGMSYALESLDMDMSDLSTATSAQREAFYSLTGQYEDLVSQIDQDKLQKFNEATQEYQLKQVEIEMQMKVAVMKLFAESSALPKLLNNITNMFQGIADILSSDTMQFAFDTFIEFINNLLSIISAPISWLGNAFSGSTSNTSNSYDTKVTQYNTYNGASNDSSSDLSLAIRQALNG
jgi:hypothetical protein